MHMADEADLPAQWGTGRWLVGALADGKQGRGGQIQVPQLPGIARLKTKMVGTGGGGDVAAKGSLNALP